MLAVFAASSQAGTSYEYKVARRTLLVSAAATGVPAATFSGPTQALETLAIGASQTTVIRLTNTGTAELTMTGSPSLSGSSAFSLSTNGATTCGATLAPGAYCETTVQFTPTEPGSVSATLSISTNAATVPSTWTLSATGLASFATWDVRHANFVASDSARTLTSSYRGWISAYSSACKSTGRWYWEVTHAGEVDGNVAVGVTDPANRILGDHYFNFSASNPLWLSPVLKYWSQNALSGNTGYASQAIVAVNATVGFALDVPGRTLDVYKNNVRLARVPLPTTGFTSYCPAMSVLSWNQGPVRMSTNFGGTAFVNTVPAGFTAGLY